MTEGWDRSRSVTQASQFIDYMPKKQGIALASIPDLCVISYNDGLIDRARSVSAYQTIRLGLTTRTELLILESNEMPAIGLIRGQHGASMSAVIHEGTSRHYGQAATLVSADHAAADLLKAVMHGLGIPHQEGLVATTDGFYRETPTFLQDVERQGVMAVDMELSAFLTVGAYHGRGVASILYVSDIIEGRGGLWHVGLTDE